MIRKTYCQPARRLSEYRQRRSNCFQVYLGRASTLSRRPQMRWKKALQDQSQPGAPGRAQAEKNHQTNGLPGPKSRCSWR